MGRPKRESGVEIRRGLESSSEYRKKLFERLLAHVREGYSIESFGPIGPETLRRAIGRWPDDFVQEDLDRAARDGRDGWERIGRRQATGECLGNSRSWYYNMSHRYGWSDRVDARVEHSGAVDVTVVNYGSPKKQD